MLERRPAPAQLVDAAGHATFGVFSGPCSRVNLEQLRLRWHGLPLPRAAVPWRVKRWQHFALVLPDAFVGVAVVDLAFLRTSWCACFDRRQRRFFEHKRLAPWLALGVADDLRSGRTFAHARGYVVEIDNALAAGEHQLRLRVDASRRGDPVAADLRCLHDLQRNQPLVASLPVGEDGVMYSLKAVMPLEGTLQIGERRYAADPRNSFAILDEHRACYPRRTFWRWATFAGRDAAGRLIGLNLTQNPNPRDDEFNENGLWVDGALQHLGPAEFSFDPARVLAPWRLRAGDDVDLVFTPQGERSEHVAAGILRSVFHQPFGTFAGTLRFAGEPLTIDGAFGLCEDHESVW